MNVVPSSRSWVRHKVARILRGFKPRTGNLSAEEMRAVKRLSGLSDVRFLPADKGRATVAMESAEYIGPKKYWPI